MTISDDVRRNPSRRSLPFSPRHSRIRHPESVTRPYWNWGLFAQEALSKTQFIRDGVDGFGRDPILYQLEYQVRIPGFRVGLWVFKREVENQGLRVGSPDAGCPILCDLQRVGV